MTMIYDGWCRRIDLSFRTRFPYLYTRIFKVDKYNFQIYVTNNVLDFGRYQKIFDDEIRFMTAPVYLVQTPPSSYEAELECIPDEDIPSNFEGMPFTLSELAIHIASVHRDAIISKIQEDHSNKLIIVELIGGIDQEVAKKVEDTVNNLKIPYETKVSATGSEASKIEIGNEVFNIAPSQVRASFSCRFIERDEDLWYENVDKIYNGEYKKSDLYFVDKSKTSCLVNFSKFQNANLRNHLLLYDVVYCVLPLLESMDEFLENQKITRDEIIELARRGRIIIINVQPEVRLDYGFLDEVYKESPLSIVSRRALSALCAIDLVELNKSYIFCDPDLGNMAFPFIKAIAELTGSNVDKISSFLLWPRQALRASLDVLNQSGPMGIARYGVNNLIINGMSPELKNKLEFDFQINSDQVHLAHALDATYFPFFIDGGAYSDHPYALMMGKCLNFYKSASYENISHIFDLKDFSKISNPSLSVISTFEINDYIPVVDFEKEISSRVVRSGMSSLFSELSLLDDQARNERISVYNLEVEKILKNKVFFKHALDLGVDTVGSFLPFFSTGMKAFVGGTKKARGKYSVIKDVSDYIQDKLTTNDAERRHISLLSKINRVARLKRGYS